MNCIDLILQKRNGGRLSVEEIRYFVGGCVDGTIPDYQAAAMLMAIWFVTLDEEETVALTLAMRDSGEVVDLSDIGGSLADKHSTGGVADSTTLITAPVAAACGLKVAKLSGRGLGHTGGTLDKLESIPGLVTSLELRRFKRIVAECGLAIAGQTSNLVPADKLLYALRDTTGTIDDASLIAASIMSKKLASGSGAIVLDVKTGSGAFMQSRPEAEHLARLMVNIGRAAGRRVEALVTSMDQPLGRAVGNSLEVREAIAVLRGEQGGNLRSVSLALAARMVLLAGMAATPQEAAAVTEHALASGRALKRLAAMIEAQNGDPRVCDNPDLLPAACQVAAVTADLGGYVTAIDTREIGMAALMLGAGRLTKADRIDPAVGIRMAKRLGDRVERGEVLAELHVNATGLLDETKARLAAAITLGPEPPIKQPLIINTLR